MWVKMGALAIPPFLFIGANLVVCLARIEGKLVGFALVTRGPGLRADGEVWDISEFFVLRRYRDRGVGSEMAEKIWRLFPGRWQIRVRSDNLASPQVLEIDDREVHKESCLCTRLRG